MPRRVFHLQALVILTLLLSAASPVAATAGETVSMPVAAVEPRFQEEVVVEEEIVEDEFSSFTMPGLAPDNLTETVLADIDAFWAGELANLGHDYYAAGTVPVTDVVQSSCGQFGPYDNPAAYCPVDEFVYTPSRWGRISRRRSAITPGSRSWPMSGDTTYKSCSASRRI